MKLDFSAENSAHMRPAMHLTFITEQKGLLFSDKKECIVYIYI